MTVRKAVPILWRYMLVVLTSCMLALIISHAHAAEVRKDYAAQGPFKVDVTEVNWTDGARKMEIPIRIESPVAADAGGANKWPVILFSHGLGGSREGGILWGDHWASHGYIVVHMQHAGSDEALWKGKAPAELVKSMKAGMSAKNLKSRVEDIHFVIDEVVRRAKAGEGAFARADVSRIGMSGHSFGAQTTLTVSGQANPVVGQDALDARIQSSIAFSPNARVKLMLAKQFGDIKLPFMSITGTKDGSILNDGTVFEDRIVPYQNMPAGDKYLAVFKDGDHMVFGGHELRGRRPETARDREIQTGVKAATLAFWDATLKGDAGARQWLKSDFKTMLKADDRFDWK